ncbi:hypothetical protein OROMI_005771 [Orobanche minor]
MIVARLLIPIAVLLSASSGSMFLAENSEVLTSQ